MDKRSIGAVSSVHEEGASLAEVFNLVTPRLVTFFRARGYKSTMAEGLAQQVMCELTGRLREALEVECSHDEFEPAVIRIGDLKLDPARRLFWRGDEEIHLTPKEFDLLALMMKNSDAVLPHVKLLRSVWGLEYGGELEYLRNYVRTLRKKIETIPASPEYIVSVPWVGYRFRKPKDSRGAEWEVVSGRRLHRTKLDPTRALLPLSLPAAAR